MAYAVAFSRVEKEDLVCLGNGLVVSQMAYVDTAIREDEFGTGGAFFRTLFTAGSLAVDVADSDGRRLQEVIDGEFRRVSFRRHLFEG
jgi:hypothetical protein